MTLADFAQVPYGLAVVDLEANLVASVCLGSRTNLMGIGHRPAPGGFHACPAILLMEYGMTENCICLFRETVVNWTPNSLTSLWGSFFGGRRGVPLGITSWVGPL